MKSCPTCNRTFDDTFSFCLLDGAILSAPYDPEATQRIPSARSTNQPPTEVMPPPPSGNDPLSSTVQSRFIPVNQRQGASAYREKQPITLLARLTRGTIGKLIFGIVIGFIFAACLAVVNLGFLHPNVGILGSLWGLVLGIAIILLKKFLGFREEVIGSIAGASLGVITIFLAMGSPQFYVFAVALGATEHPSGGLFGAIVFGVVLGVILGAAHRLTAADAV